MPQCRKETVICSLICPTTHFLGLEQNFRETVVAMTDSRVSDIATSLSLTSHFLGETSAEGKQGEAVLIPDMKGWRVASPVLGAHVW